MLKEQGKLTDDQMLWFENPGRERLFDTQNDPFELHDLSKDTLYTEILDRLRLEMDNWLTRVEDWSEIHENEMVKRFQPDNEQLTTANPAIKFDGKEVSISSENKASIGYRVDDGPWQLYLEPFIFSGSRLTAKAVRYGWKESEEVEIKL